jgi:hypothetical protein
MVVLSGTLLVVNLICWVGKRIKYQVKEIGCRQVGDFSVFFNTATWRTPPSLNPWSSSYKN